MRQTTNAYIKTLESLAEKQGITDLRTQVNTWGHPQADQSHIAIWRESWKTISNMIPNNSINIMIEGSYHSSKWTIREEEPLAKEVILQLL